MGIRDAAWNTVKWEAMKAHLGYTDIELLYAGVDPKEMRFRRAACFDVGVQCGGWGRIVLELGVQDRKKG